MLASASPVQGDAGDQGKLPEPAAQMLGPIRAQTLDLKPNGDAASTLFREAGGAGAGGQSGR